MIIVLALVASLQLANGEPVAATPPAAAPGPEAPRSIDDLSRPLSGAVPQGSYEAGVKGAFSRTQSLQGPLDGTWMLKDAAGAGLYRVQLVDPGFSGGRLEGAWQDLRAGPAMEASGFFSGVAREGERLTLQFARTGAGQMVVTLDRRPDGAYAGEIRSGGAGQGDKPEAVVLVRP